MTTLARIGDSYTIVITCDLVYYSRLKPSFWRMCGRSPLSRTCRNAVSQDSFRSRVYDVVRCIPEGHVTTYGAIARSLGAPRSARMVGWAMAQCPPEISDVAHRVVNRDGVLSGGWAWGHPEIMRALLEDEGVVFMDTGQVDLARHFWNPETPEDVPE